MDPASLVDQLVTEITLDSTHGTTADQLWVTCAKLCGAPIDSELQSAIWRWVLGCPNIVIKNEKLYASEDLQWMTLTGLARAGNPVGRMTFELLRLVAHSRHSGISTVAAARQLGQDLRSLFSRAQTLVKLGVVQRFPVIEHGNSTNLLVFHTYVASHESGDVIDKNAVCARIVEYVKSGVQRVRLASEISREIGATLNLTRSRQKPTVRGCLNDLEAGGYVRRVTMVHPNHPERQFLCIEYVADLAVASSGGFATTALTRGPILGPRPSGAEDDNDSDTEADAEAEAGVEAETQTGDENDHTERDGSGSGSGSGSQLRTNKLLRATGPSPKANVLYPFLYQLYDTIRASNASGISAMQIAQLLTGKAYAKVIGKFLDGLTAPLSTGPLGEIPQIGHLTLVRGIDFERRVKFYRYFTRIAYSKITDGPPEWGEFIPAPKVDASLSLKNLETNCFEYIPGACSVVRTPSGELKPVFYGEMGTKGEIILRSGGVPPSANLAKGKRPRGRPRKNAPKVETEPEPKITVPAPPRHAVALRERSWRGGHPALASSLPAAQWLQYQSDDLPVKSEISHSYEDIDPSITPQVAAPSSSTTASPQQQPSTARFDTSVGSLAHHSRAQTLLRIVRDNGGVHVGGKPLLKRFDELESGDFAVDRRTVQAVISNLVQDGRLQKIYINVPRASGAQAVKYLIYDPQIIANPDTDHAIAEAKIELIEGNRDKRAHAMRTALDAMKKTIEAQPKREMNDEQLKLFRPNLFAKNLTRMLTTRSTRERGARRERVKFGPSAADVLGVDNDGTLKSRAKRRARNPSESAGARIIRGLDTEMGQGGQGIDENDSLTEAATKVLTSKKSQSRRTPTDLDLDRLARTVIVYRSLSPCGTAVDWKVITAAMNTKVSIAEVRRRWQEARATFAGSSEDSHVAQIICKKTEQFEDLFFDAYTRGLVEYDDTQDPAKACAKYVEWWRKAETGPPVPKSSSEYTGEQSGGTRSSEQAQTRLSQLTLTERVPAWTSSSNLDPFSSLQTQASIVNAERLLLSSAFYISCKVPAHSVWHELTNDEMRLRAVIAADNGATYSAQNAAWELNGLTNGDTEKAKHGLEHKKIIHWAESDPTKIPAGRPYVLSEQVISALNVPRLDDNVPRNLENVSISLESTPALDIHPTIDEAEMIYLLELCAFGLNGRFGKLRRVGEKFGLLSSDYKSRGIDRQEFECKLVCDLVDAEVGPHSGYGILPPKSPEAHRPWLWDVRYLTGKHVWFKVAYRILTLAHFRPGITSLAICLALRQALLPEETNAAVATLVAGGALATHGNGYTAVPNWFDYL